VRLEPWRRKAPEHHNRFADRQHFPAVSVGDRRYPGQSATGVRGVRQQNQGSGLPQNHGMTLDGIGQCAAEKSLLIEVKGQRAGKG